MKFKNKKFSVIKTPEKNLKGTKIKKPHKDRLPDPYAITYDNLEYKFDNGRIEVSVDGIMKGITKNSGVVSVRENYGENAFQSAVTIAQDQARDRLINLKN